MLKKVSWWSKNLVQSPACRMDTKETPATKCTDAAVPLRVPKDQCALAILKTFLIHKEIILAHADMCCLQIPRREKTPMIDENSS